MLFDACKISSLQAALMSAAIKWMMSELSMISVMELG